jgi:inorganic pyrophosphatase
MRELRSIQLGEPIARARGSNSAESLSAPAQSGRPIEVGATPSEPVLSADAYQTPSAHHETEAATDALARYLAIVSHPWHGVTPFHKKKPGVSNVFIEIPPNSPLKYELDKDSGLIRVDRPHKFSSTCPTAYGFIPRTYCAERVAKLAEGATGKSGIEGDGDPLDVCVLSKHDVTEGGILVGARAIGGLRMLDRGADGSQEADDKIVMVLDDDPIYGEYQDIKDVPRDLLDQLIHYFKSYKGDAPAGEPARIEIAEIYGVDEAKKTIQASIEDYDAHRGEILSQMGL